MLCGCCSLGFVDCDVTSDFDDSVSALGASDVMVLPPQLEVDSSDESVTSSSQVTTVPTIKITEADGVQAAAAQQESENDTSSEEEPPLK